MAELNRTWETNPSISFDDLATKKAADAREIWPVFALSLSDQEGDRELELCFDVPVGKLLEFTAGAILDATDGARSWAVPVTWSYHHEGERLEREESSLIYRPMDGDAETIGIDLVQVTSEAAPPGGNGRFDESVELESDLPLGPIPVSVEKQLSALAAVGRETVAFYREHGTDPSAASHELPMVVDEVETVLNAVQEGKMPAFDISLERFEELVHPTDGKEIGPIETDWLRAHALEAGVIEDLIRERVSDHPPERAGDLYYGLITRGDDAYAERALSVLARHPDEKALHALLMCLWYDDPDLTPQAMAVLGLLLETKTTFTENDQGFDQGKVIREIRTCIESSDHPEVKVAAIETLSGLEPANPTLIDRDQLVETLEGALTDSDEDVRYAAEDALSALE